jgi:hypothetical protein
MVLNYLDQPQFQLDVEAVSNNHFDEDGLVGLWAMLNPDEAQERRETLLDIASAGDFGTYTERDCARMCFVISAWTKPDISPLKPSVFQLSYPEQTMILYEELLPRLSKIMDRCEYLEQYWKPQDQLLDHSEQQVREAEVKIDEFCEADLAVVNLPRPKQYPNQELEQLPAWNALVHPFAIHNSTSMMRILLVQGQRYRLYYRYETWVEYISRKLMPRIDLTDLAKQLNGIEKSRGQWQAGDIADMTPSLETQDGRSSIESKALVEHITSYLISRKELENSG